MEALIKLASGYIALAVEAAAALLIACGMIEALVGLAATIRRPDDLLARRRIWTRFGVWLLLGLEFEFAADIIRTAISPSWTDIGQLAAIAGIRTFLNFFLESDLEKGVALRPGDATPT